MKVSYSQRTNEIVLRDESKPKAGKNQIVLIVQACGICGTDIHSAMFFLVK
jgi:D-arabinose 1-dehydrogenase-like Zn-dependent alcohol dehydrogenase